MTSVGASTRAQANAAVRDEKPAKRKSDAQLLESFLTRDGATAERAFTRLVERHGAAVQRVCYEVLGDRHEAQDAAQAVFLVLARKARSIRKPESLGSWLHGVALRAARRARGEAKRRKEIERRAFEETARRIERGELMELSDHPELRGEIDRLPERYRLPLVLCYYEGYTQEEAARVLGWPYGTVQTRLHRGRRVLRERLERGSPGVFGIVGSVLPLSMESDVSTPTPGWAAATARAAVRFAGGAGAGDLLAPSVTQLAGLVLTSMLKESLRGTAVAVTAVGLFVAGLAIVGLGTPRTRTDALDARQSSEKPQGRPGPAEAEIQAPRSIVHAKKTGDAPRKPAVVAVSLPRASAPAAPLPGSRRLQFVLPKASSELPAKDPRNVVPDGRELFERIWAPNDPRSHSGDGLGPVFNARSCVDCHDQGGAGGAGPATRNIEIATAAPAPAPGNGYAFFYAFSMDFGAGKFDYRIGDDGSRARSGSFDATAAAAVHPGFRQSRSVVLHRFGTGPSYPIWRQSIPGPHESITVRTSQRSPTPLFGVGLIDAIPDEALVAASKRRSPGSPQISGRVGRLKDGRAGRFGWKAQTATLREFVLSAAAGEMGLEVEDHPQADDPSVPSPGAPGLDMKREESDALIAFVRGLPRPVVREPVDAGAETTVEQGEKTFKTIGCTGCHVPKLGDVEGIYSDLLLHDMSPELEDTGGYSVFVDQPAGLNGLAAVGEPHEGEAAARPGEWRTPPLWGLRDSAPYLHDGRAETIGRAVLLHGGEGAVAADRYARLSARRKQQLDAFLHSLAAP